MPFPPPPEGGFSESQVTWVFGHPRSGTTWLGRLLDDGLNLKLWNEPYMGQLLGFLNILRRNDPLRFEDPTFWMSDPQRDNWRASLNALFTDVIARQAGPLGDRVGLAIKEPNGSVAAPVILEAMPQATAIFMLRDPRDVIASLLDARKPGSWMDARLTLEFDRTKIVKQSIARFEKISEALTELESKATGRVYLMRYAEMRDATLVEMRKMAETLGIPVDEARLSAAVDKHSYENIPDENKGPGKFVRTAKVGGWQEELEKQEVRLIHRKLRPFLMERGFEVPPRSGAAE